MITKGQRRLWSLVILQALKDSVDLSPIGYQGESGSYSANEARTWLKTEGRKLLLLMGFSVLRVDSMLRKPQALIDRFEQLTS